MGEASNRRIRQQEYRQYHNWVEAHDRIKSIPDLTEMVCRSNQNLPQLLLPIPLLVMEEEESEIPIPLGMIRF